MNIEDAPSSAPEDRRPSKRCKTDLETTDSSSSLVTDVPLHILTKMPDDIAVEVSLLIILNVFHLSLQQR